MVAPENTLKRQKWNRLRKAINTNLVKLLEEHGLEKSTIDLKINIPSKYGHFRYERIGNEVVKTDLECTKRSVSKKEEIDLKWPDWFFRQMYSGY